uniref:Reverse transcriptase domain-containing protein n=1 Tax=Fagus sylvatica TaxID=28930 RepID=A0A2N9IPM7_FAGSY
MAVLSSTPAPHQILLGFRARVPFSDPIFKGQFWRPSGAQNGSCSISSESSRRPTFQRYKVCVNRSSDERVMAPGSRGVGAVFVCFSGEDSGQTGDATGEPRVARRSRSHYLSNAPGLAGQLVSEGRRGVFGPFEDSFPIVIPARPGKFLAILRVHVVHECVFFPTCPGLRINLLRVRKTLCASVATSVGKFRKFQHSLISSACFHARGRRSSRCRILTILVSSESLRYLLFQRYRPCTEASLGSQDMILRTEAVGMFLMPRGQLGSGCLVLRADTRENPGGKNGVMTAGLRKGDFIYDLCKDPPETLSELMNEAQKHMNAEDALESMDDPPLKRRKDIEDRKQETAKQKVPKFSETPKRKRTTTSTVKFSSFTPLNTPIDKLLMQIQDDPSLRWPGTCPMKPPTPKEQIENNRLGPFGEIRTIIGGPAFGGTSRALRKAYARQGTHQPHDDALIVTINIAGFTGNSVCLVGIITLPITVGTYLKTVSKTIDFLVVNCPSAYNAIIGQPTLNRLRVVTSTYHLLIKFPTEHGIGEVRGDQIAAKECYLASLGSEGQNQTMTIEERKTLVDPSEELDTIELEDGHPEKTTRIGASLPPQIKKSLIQFLKSNKDVFAWSPEDMPGINPSIISHKLNVNPSLHPVKQKRRVFALERNDAIMEEVDKLLTVNFIREVFYPDWLVNVVMVKKNTGKWRICVDFTDLNKAYPKDSFPLPRIDQLVDSTAGHKLLTFMDAFSGYNQIMMDENDQEKTSFITSRGLFCYKVMPFGLKNAGATYQRLMNRMFHDQISRNVKVYVDDMLVKSTEEDNHLDDLGETFKTLRKYQMKLNPSKCAFDVYSDKFLGFMVSHRGIEANPDKIKAILEMQPPKTTKEIQRLTGRVAALNRFVSRPSKQGEELYLYLVVSPTAISSVLVREEDRRQLPVYYTSRALRGAEERYPPMEKLAFALVTVARKLRPYF